MMIGQTTRDLMAQPKWHIKSAITWI
jgi:hypothetical protein